MLYKYVHVPLHAWVCVVTLIRQENENNELDQDGKNDGSCKQDLG